MELSFTHYQRMAKRTMAKHLNEIEGVHVSTMGLAAEAGEVCGEIKKAAEQDRTIDKKKVAEEMGDVLWYLADLATRLDLDLEIVAKANIIKLKRRHPEGFTIETSKEQRDKQKTEVPRL